MGIGQYLLISLVGLGVVFLVLVVLMACIVITSKVIGNGKKKEVVTAAAPAVAAAPAAASVIEPVYASGSAGGVKTFGVSDRTAAMVMAIVADQMEEPLNELRFKSIKEMDAKK